jgi:hypothetical protein
VELHTEELLVRAIVTAAILSGVALGTCATLLLPMPRIPDPMTGAGEIAPTLDPPEPVKRQKDYSEPNAFAERVGGARPGPFQSVLLSKSEAGHKLSR